MRLPDYTTSICQHLLDDPDSDYSRHFTGHGTDSWFLCPACSQIVRRGDGTVPLQPLDRDGEGRLASEGFQEEITGCPSITDRKGGLLSWPPVREYPLPGTAPVSLAPLGTHDWLLYDAAGNLDTFDPETGERKNLGCFPLPEEKDAGWCGHHLRARLITDPTGRYAAVVHDFGRYGQVIDLETRTISASLDGGSYYPETVPFSACFIMHEGYPVLIHRTDWNRLDASDPASGRLLTEREILPYTQESGRPAHYLDYFHGGLHPSPSGDWVLDDGWVWHPLGMPALFHPHAWLAGNVWETEDRLNLDIFPVSEGWNSGFVWIDNERAVIERLFSNDPDAPGLVFVVCCSRENQSYPLAGPRGHLFSDGTHLFSAHGAGLSVWNPEDGTRIGFVSGFAPTIHHPDRRELVQVTDGLLRCWSYDVLRIKM